MSEAHRRPSTFTVLLPNVEWALLQPIRSKDKVVLVAMATYADKTYWVRVSPQTLSELIGRDTPSICRSIIRLQELQLIENEFPPLTQADFDRGAHLFWRLAR
jgi:hypothetical protein